MSETYTTPKTIEELQAYCAQKGMPLEKMRFFIGDDYREAKAFGIYRAGNTFVVYKNKDTGERAIRYCGPDEAYAVNEIYMKLLDECHLRGIYPERSDSGFVGSRSSGSEDIIDKKERLKALRLPICIGIAFIVMFIAMLSKKSKHPQGYYGYNDRTYYYIGSTWYEYDDYSHDWNQCNNSDTSSIYNGEKYYYQGSDWDDSWGNEDYSFKNSDAYDDYKDSQESDYDSWDSSDTDWGSDW